MYYISDNPNPVKTPNFAGSVTTKYTNARRSDVLNNGVFTICAVDNSDKCPHKVLNDKNNLTGIDYTPLKRMRFFDTFEEAVSVYQQMSIPGTFIAYRDEKEYPSIEGVALRWGQTHTILRY